MEAGSTGGIERSAEMKMFPVFPDLFPVCSQSRPMNSLCSRCSGLLPLHQPMWTSCPHYCHIFNHQEHWEQWEQG